MKYFFLSNSWITGRIWEFGGLWDETARRRKPLLTKLNLCIRENEETLWLFQTEDAVLMLEVKPKELEAGSSPTSTIGQVVLKRLLSADQVIERLCQETFFHLSADSTPFTMADLAEDSLHPSSERHVMNPSVSANQTFATLEAKTAYSSAPLS